MQKYGEHLTRMGLKYLHTSAVSIWIGGGLAVMVLLDNGRQTSNGDELIALDGAIVSIDDYLIVPAAAVTFLSGILICTLTNWGVFRHRWIMVKLLLTIGAIAFGIFCLGPWLKELSLVAAVDRFAVYDDGGYSRICRLAGISGVLQTAVLSILVLISTFKPSFAIRRDANSGTISPYVISKAFKQRGEYRKPRACTDGQ